MVLQAIKYQRGSLQLLDQRKLPLSETWINIPSVDAAWHAIKDMAVRGAPAIAIAAALSLAVDLTSTGQGGQFASVEAAGQHIQKQLDYLVTRCERAAMPTSGYTFRFALLRPRPSQPKVQRS